MTTRKEQARARLVRERGPREDMTKKQDRDRIASHLRNQLESAEKKLKTASDAKLIQRLKGIISNIKSTLKIK